MSNWYDYNYDSKYENKQENINVCDNIMNLDTYKHNFEHVYEYNESDAEIDLLNIYGSIYLYCKDSIENIKGIGQIEIKYLKLQNRIKKDSITNPEIKNLIKTINTHINDYNSNLNIEINKKQVLTNFNYGFCFGLGISMIVGICTYFYKEYK